MKLDLVIGSEKGSTTDDLSCRLPGNPLRGSPSVHDAVQDEKESGATLARDHRVTRRPRSVARMRLDYPAAGCTLNAWITSAHVNCSPASVNG